MKKGGGSYPGKGVMSIVRAAAPGSVNFSTDGTLGWVALVASSTVPSRQSNPHCKRSGPGLMKSSWEWCQTTGGSVNTGVGGVTISGTEGDDTSIPTAGTTNTGYAYGTGITGIGFRFEAPADAWQTRSLKVYAGIKNGTLRIRGILSDGSATMVEDSVVEGAGTRTDYLWSISYKPARDGQRITLLAELSATIGAAQVWFYGASLTTP